MYLRFKKLTFDVKLVLKFANDDRVEAGCSCGRERSEIQLSGQNGSDTKLRKKSNSKKRRLFSFGVR